MKRTVGYIFIVFLCTLLILNPEKSIQYASSGLNLCTEIIIPSLFPFFVCSGLLIYSGLCEVIAKIFSPIMKPLFNVNPTGAAAFVLGAISGYPTGAVTAGQLYEGMYLSKSEAERLLAFCNNSGPLFILGTVGVSIYHSTTAGIILYVSHILGAITTGIVFRFYKTKTFSAPTNRINTVKKSASQIFSDSIQDSIKNMLTVCATILFCSVISRLLCDILSLNGTVLAVFSSFLEFVSGLGNISYLDLSTLQKLLLSSAVCAFAGISVHLQVMGVISKTGLSLKPYIIGKILHAFFATLYTFIILKITPLEQSVFVGLNSEQKMGLGFFIGALCVMLFCLGVCVLFLMYTITCVLKKQKLKNLNKVNAT